MHDDDNGRRFFQGLMLVWLTLLCLLFAVLLWP